MVEQRFALRLACSYESPDNRVAGVAAQIHDQGEWQPFVPALGTPGFQLFLYALLTCQHTSFRLNCAERQLVLASAEGSLDLVTDRDWKIQRMQVRFAGRLAAGAATRDDIDYIAARMAHCPVSSNLYPVPERDTRVELA